MVKLVFLGLAGLLASIAGAVVLWPLFRDKQQRYLGGILVALMAMSTWGLYQWLGTPAALQPLPVVAAPKTLEEGVAQLQAVLEREPQRLEGWVLLAHSQAELGRLDEAAAAWVRALQLAPENPLLLLEAAQARMQAQAQFLLDDTAVQWLLQAYDLAPDNERVVWLLGVARHQRGEPAQAVQLWESLLPRLPAEAANALREQIHAVRAASGLLADTGSDDDSAAISNIPNTGTHTISVQITLDQTLKTRATAATDTVFIIARLVDGPPMPVAVQRHRARAIPPTIVLSDADSPMPTQNLSALSEVEVIVRLSASGLAARQEGDIESTPIRVHLPTDTPLLIPLHAP